MSFSNLVRILPIRVLALIFAALVLSHRVHAQESTLKMPPAKDADSLAPASPAATSTVSVLKPKRQKTVLRDELSFSMLQESFINRQKPPAGVADYTQIGAHFRTESEGRTFRGTLELGGSFATSVENYNNLYVPEAFLDLRSADWADHEARVFDNTITPPPGEENALRGRVSIGRRLENWSQLDRHWDLGIWEPLNRFDLLRPIDQGLTGVFAEGGRGKLRVIAFGTPLFIPEQSPGFNLQNGKFTSPSPWFVEPTDRLILFSKTTDVQYDVRTPSVGSVIGHPAVGGLVRYGSLEEGFYTQASYAFKPRNQLTTPFTAVLSLTETTSYASVTIEPKVVYHQLAGAEVGYQTENWMAGFSALTDVPLNENPGANLTYQELDPIVLWSPRVEGRTDLGMASDLRVGLSYLQSVGGGATMRGPFASEKAVFGARNPYREAIALDGRMTLGRGRRTTMTVGGRWLEELAEQGSLLMADASVDFSMSAAATQDWRLSFYADVLGSRLAANENQGYVSRYRGNDRWMSQLRFVF